MRKVPEEEINDECVCDPCECPDECLPKKEEECDEFVPHNVIWKNILKEKRCKLKEAEYYLQEKESLKPEIPPSKSVRPNHTFHNLKEQTRVATIFFSITETSIFTFFNTLWA